MADGNSNIFPISRGEFQDRKSDRRNFGDKVPPHSKDAEMAVLGSVMLDRAALTKVQDILLPESFYYESHRLIYEASLNLSDKGITPDISALTQELYRREQLEFIGGSFYLTEINARTPTAANVEFYAITVQENYLKRQLIESAGQILQGSYDESSDALEEIDNAERLIFAIGEKLTRKTYIDLKKLAKQAFKTITENKERDSNTYTGVPTGYTELDKMLGGFQKSDLIIIAGRPSMGKTALGLSIIRNTAKEYHKPVAFFSIEMSDMQLVIRLISAEARIDQEKIRNGELNENEFQRIINKLGVLAEMPILIDDSPMLSVMELRAKCRRLKAEHDIQLVVVDYLQLMHPPKAESREREISIISRSMKQIAKELNIPVLALAQLNRSVEGRSDKRPLLSDLRESGSIEQDADVVIFVNRLEQYGILTYDDNSPTEGTAEIIVGKQRNGRTGIVKLAYQKEYARFENLEFRYDDVPENLPQGPDDDPGF